MSKKKLDLYLKGNSKNLLYYVMSSDLSSISSLTRTSKKLFFQRTVWASVWNIMGNIPILLIRATKSLGIYLCLEDTAKIKYCYGIPRGKNDKIDAYQCIQKDVMTVYSCVCCSRTYNTKIKKTIN